ncbi:BA14K family protein [Rhizobium mayense]|uniref:Lectin-like protein BA14k n=1 Tax=Rhizobium mayense TaxID=1312184 RepID=A0ABT7JU24_9HYPH|nr:BA14K family protein [Rhizobium mayense]MDL2399854.1 BA14K family protein [Rhizobium mayense]
MRTINRSMVAVGFGALLAAGAAMPAGAITMPTLTVPEQSNIIQVHGHNHNRIRGGHNNNHGFDGYYDDDTDSGVLFKSFVTGTLFNRQGTEGYYDSHARACADRYQSYRASDNTYQPSHGPRRQCR